MPGTDVFDAHAAEYEAWFEQNPLAYVSELHAVKALLPTKGEGLEIGVGTGRFASPLGIRRGIEPSEIMAAVAKRRGVEVVPGVAEKLPFRDGEFDVALMVTTVCFLDDMDLAFSEAHRVLKPSGSFLIGFVDRESPIGKSYLEKQSKRLFYKDATFYSVPELVEHLTKAEFRDFAFRQTLFHHLPDIRDVEPVKDGHGQGSFVVIRAKKHLRVTHLKDTIKRKQLSRGEKRNVSRRALSLSSS
jgi:SAM-dependent methyltransferase